MTPQIYVDNRERGGIVNLIREQLQKRHLDYPIETRNLPVGDIVCANLVIERKDETKGDYTSSLLDKKRRLENQLAAMQQFPHRYLIIIGDPYQTPRNIHRNSLNGLQAKAAVDYDTKILTVPTPEDYAYLATALIDRTTNPRENLGPVFFGEHRRLTKKQVLVNMLGQIHGVGSETALVLVEDFGLGCPQDFVRINWENYRRLREGGRLQGIGEKTFQNLLMDDKI